MINLSGKTAIVTGGASGIGLATVEAFVKKGMNVVLADSNEEGGQAAAENLNQKR